MKRVTSLILALAFLFSGVSAMANPDAADLFQIPLKNGARLAIAQLPTDPDSLAAYQALTETEKLRFLERRQDMIASVVKYMTFPKTLGGIKWFKNQIVRVREVTNRTGALINWVGRHLHLVQSGQPSENFLEKTPEVKAAPETITELGIKALSEIVQVMDHELWKDAPLIARSRKTGWTFYLGGSVGMGIGKTGFYKANAIELDIDYDYEKQEKEINIYLGRQEFKNSVFVFELHMIFGALKRHATGVVSESAKTEVTALPLVVGYRRSSEQVALGLASGISLIDTAASVLIATGYPEAGGAILSVAKPLHSFSMFWTDLTRTRLYSKTLKQSQPGTFRKLRCQALFNN